jgi:serine/threonine-protein kinase RsbW
MRIVFSLCLPRDESSVPVVRRVCSGAMRTLGVEDDCAHDIGLAVTEACTNVLKHAVGLDDQYDVTVEVNDTNCEIRVVDAGVGFDHAAHGRSTNPNAEGGRGIFLMRALVDRVDFASEPESGTMVHLVKELDFKDDSLLKTLGASVAARRTLLEERNAVS